MIANYKIHIDKCLQIEKGKKEEKFERSNCMKRSFRALATRAKNIDNDPI